ncbi:hypothetical protein [Mycolicibacterium chubuense]|uniref:N-ethylmaleimide reductase n=1 Tax=Mycolicibacterium chubuense TaxID=1800 RepID=A0A0J6VV75_MYCCU|nr:hypothetical protein [Mycolicibacterium chubuense]KMO73342.1 N-ethylmaleimide reductase [Mycolicibacterium chubuense]SPX98876.1 NADH:flavin oxidoreductase [Mycolicibacterium chubuense]
MCREWADLVTFGRLFTSNHDLPRRLRVGYPLTHYDRSTFWGGTEHGHTDFPAYADSLSDADVRLVHRG